MPEGPDSRRDPRRGPAAAHRLRCLSRPVVLRLCRRLRAVQGGHAHPVEPAAAESAPGTLTYNGINLSSAPQESLSVTSAPFTGTISGSSVMLTPSGGSVINGTLGTGTLTGTGTPYSSTGAIDSGTLSGASVSTYNRDVAGLRSAISQANVLATQQQAASSNNSRMPRPSALAQDLP
jgi:hypothetical protein